MTTKALAIKEWSSSFMLSQNARIGTWGKLPIPIKLTGEHFRMLMAFPKGREAYAVFLALAALAANLPRRGVLASADGPLSEFALHVKTGVPIKALREAMTLLRSADYGWLVETDWTPISVGADSESLTESDTESDTDRTPRQSKQQQQQRLSGAKQQPQQSGAEPSGDGAAAVEGHGDGTAAAVAASGSEHVRAILRAFWPDGNTAEDLARHENATLIRVLWLKERALTQKMRTGPNGRGGFIRKGILEGWEIDPEWVNSNRQKLTRWGVLTPPNGVHA